MQKVNQKNVVLERDAGAVSCRKLYQLIIIRTWRNVRLLRS